MLFPGVARDANMRHIKTGQVLISDLGRSTTAMQAVAVSSMFRSTKAHWFTRESEP